MSSDAAQCYVWTWLPGSAEPVVAGVLRRGRAVYRDEPVLLFRYGQSYRAREDAISLFTPELPLTNQQFDPLNPSAGRDPLALHSCLRDAAPDSWGRRVVNARLHRDQDTDAPEMTYLLAGSSNRIGALHFQTGSKVFVPDSNDTATLTDLMEMSDRVAAGEDVPAPLADAARHGTSIGGARPKALLLDDDRQLIAKFSLSTDTRPVVGAEAVAMLLAKRAGLNVATVWTERVSDRDVLLVERFDRTADGGRRAMVSALTILGYHELSARHASYFEICQAVAKSFAAPSETFRELFARAVMNVCVGNTDDHLRNHSAFWDGRTLELTPAYDIAPQPRSSREANQAIALTRGGDRSSTLATCRAAAAGFNVPAKEADDIIDHVVTQVKGGFADACDEARVSSHDRQSLWGREFMNPYVFEKP